MSLSVQVYDEPPEALEALLSSHMPYSLPLLRRLQFSKHKGLSSPAERFILVSDSANDAFTAAYLDVAGGPDTHMWLYSTLEDGNDDSNEDEYYRTQLDRLARAAVDVAKQHGKPTLYPEGVLLGSLHTRVRRLLQDMGRLTARSSGYYDKWIFRAGELPGADVALPEGLRWDVPTYEDCETVVERADVPRTA